MADMIGNIKRKARKICFILIGMLGLFVIQVDAYQESRVLCGVYTGSSFGVGNEYTWSESGHVSAYFTPFFHLGGYVQFNLSEQWGLQFNVNYQNGTKNWTWSSLGSSQRFGTDPTGFISIDLNGVLNYLRLKNAHFYLLGGFGINSTYWASDGLCFNFAGGTGVKIHSKKYPRSAVNIGGTFHHLLGSTGSKPIHDNYLRLNVGFEFYPTDHKANSSN